MSEAVMNPVVKAQPTRRGWTRVGRLRDALGSRDWTGVAIELAVVIAGILIAFQFSEWGDARKRERDEREFKERLFTEVDQGRLELEELVAGHSQVIEQVGAAIRARDKPDLLARFARRMDYGCGLGTLRAAEFNDTARDELIASGRLNSIQDPSLRALLRKMVASQAQGAAQIDYGRQSLNYNMPNIDPYYSLVIDERNNPICFIEWPQLVRDRRALTATTRLVRRHILVRDARIRTLELIGATQEQLACDLGKQTCRRKGS